MPSEEPKTDWYHQRWLERVGVFEDYMNINDLPGAATLSHDGTNYIFSWFKVDPFSREVKLVERTRKLSSGEVLNLTFMYHFREDKNNTMILTAKNPDFGLFDRISNFVQAKTPKTGV